LERPLNSKRSLAISTQVHQRHPPPLHTKADYRRFLTKSNITSVESSRQQSAEDETHRFTIISKRVAPVAWASYIRKLSQLLL